MSVDKEYSMLCMTEKPLKEYIHVEVVIQYIMGQSWVEIEHYSVAYFDCVTAFEVL